MEKFNPAELKYCEGCTNDICVDCVIGSLRDSEYGRLLQKNPPRFSRFQWEDEGRFRRYMGYDVDPLLHGIYQAEHVALPFIEAQNSSPNHDPFTRDEAKMLIIGNVLHDAHEGITGDVALPDKTEDTYEAELRTNLEVVSELLGLPHNSSFMLAYRAVVGDLRGWSHAGRAFNAIEHCGYFLTGLRAWSMRRHTELDDNEQAEAERLGREVLTKNLPSMRQYEHEFAFVAMLLRYNEIAIAAANGLQ